MELDDTLFQNILNYEATMYRMLDMAMKEFVLEARLSGQEAIVWKLKDSAPGPRLFKDPQNLGAMKAATLQWLQDTIEGKSNEDKAELGNDIGLSVRKLNQPKYKQQNVKAEERPEERQQETSEESDFNTEDHAEVFKPSAIDSPIKESGEWIQEPVVRYSWEPLYPTPTFSYKSIPWDEKNYFKCGAKGHFDDECSQQKQQIKHQPNELQVEPSHDARSSTMASFTKPNCSDCGPDGHNILECLFKCDPKRAHSGDDDHVEECRDVLPEPNKGGFCSYCGESGHRDGECWYLHLGKQGEFFQSRRSLCKRNGY